MHIFTNKLQEKSFTLVFLHDIHMWLLVSLLYISDTTHCISVKFGFRGYTLKSHVSLMCIILVPALHETQMGLIFTLYNIHISLRPVHDIEDMF